MASVMRIGDAQGEVMRIVGIQKDMCADWYTLHSRRGPVTSTPSIQKGTRVLISLWDSLMFGWVPGTRPNISESHSEISTRVPFCIEGVLVTGPAPEVA